MHDTQKQVYSSFITPLSSVRITNARATTADIEGKKVSCVASGSLCARTYASLEWNYLLVIHVEWRTNGFDVKNERAILLFPRCVTVVFLTA